MNGKIDDACGGVDPAHITTVKEKMKEFTQHGKKSAATPRKFHNSAGLTTASVISVVDKKILNNCPITRESTNMRSVYGDQVSQISTEKL